MATAASAADPALVKAAEDEGAVSVYYCDDSTPFEQFKKAYPKIKVTTYLAGCWQVYNRYQTERRAGRGVGDVMIATEDVMATLDDAKQLAAYQSPELKNFPASSKPAGRNFSYHKAILFGMAYNRDHVGKEPVPLDWFDYATPKANWKDQTSFYDPRTSSTAFLLLATLHQNFGAEKTASIYKGLISIDAELAPTTTAGMAKLMSGEKPIMFYLLNNHYSRATKQGAPIEFTVPKSGTVIMPLASGIYSDAPHPNAAKLFVDYLLDGGQAATTEMNEYALKNGSKPPAGMPALSEVKTLPVDVQKALKDQKELLAWWQTTTGIR